MSFFVPDPATTTTIATLGSKLLGNIFGGSDGPNIARNLSKQVGFTVLQRDADEVRRRISRGLDPRTGQPVNKIAMAPPPAPRPPTVRQPTPVMDTPKPGFDLKGEFQRALAQFTTGLTKQVEQKLAPLDRPLDPVIFPNATPQTTERMRQVIRAPASPPPRLPPPTSRIGSPKMSALSLSMSGLPAIAGRIGAGMAGRGIARTATGRISSIVLASGQRFSRKSAAALIRKVGLEAAAVALGIGVVEAAEILLADSQAQARRRRGRGITAAQLRNAKRVNCTVKRMAADLGCGVRATPTRRRKTSCR